MNSAPVVAVIEASARMFPEKTVFVPMVAELPTCQKTLSAVAPPVRMTWLPDAVVSPDAIWKIKILAAFP